MNYQPISPQQARTFIHRYIGERRVPTGLKWFQVNDLQYFPVGRRNLYLVAGERGLEGVYGVAGKSESKIIHEPELEAI